MNADQLRERHNELLRIEAEQEKQQNILRDKYGDLEEKHNAGQIDEPAYQQKVHGRFLTATEEIYLTPRYWPEKAFLECCFFTAK